MKKIRKIGAIALGLLTMTVAQAQNQYVGINFGGGMHSLHHKPEIGESKGGGGITINLEYLYFFNDNWGVGTGAGVSFYNSRTILDGLDKSLQKDPTVVSTHTDSCYLVTTYSGWEEKQSGVLLEIPVGIHFRHAINDKMDLLLGAGPKFFFNMSCKYEVKAGEYNTQKEFPAENVMIVDLPHHECGTYGKEFGIGTKQSRQFGFGIFLDFGLNYALSEHLTLYGGLYSNIGITNIIKKDKNILDLDAKLVDTEGIYHGVFASDMTEKVAPLAIGVKVGVMLPFGSSGGGGE